MDDNLLRVNYGPADDSGPSYHLIKIPVNYLNARKLCKATWGWQPENMDQADIILIQRQIAAQTLEFVKEAKKRGKTIMYILEDNMFQLPPHSPVFHYYGPQVIQTACNIMKSCHAVTTTTPYLANEIRKYSGQQNIYVLPHLIAKEHYDRITPGRTDGEVRIGWTTTPYHVGDWPICSHAIKDICKKYPQVRVILWGFINESMAEYIPQEQLEFYSWVPVHEFYRVFTAMDFDIGIAPLEDTPYNNSKTELKWVEYSALAIPTVCSPTPPYDPVVHMETGLKPKKNRYNEWYRWLEYLIENPEERVRIGQNARNHMLQNYEGMTAVEKYWDAYMEVHNRVQKGWKDVGL